MTNRDVIAERHRRYHTWARAYDSAASEVGDRGRWFSVSTACLSALVSSAIFTSLAADNVDPRWKIVTALVSLIATILGAAAAALGYHDVSARYRKAALSCVGLEQRAEELFVHAQITDAQLADYDKKASKAEQGFPIIAEKYYRKAEAYIRAHGEGDPFESHHHARAAHPVGGERSAGAS